MTDASQRCAEVNPAGERCVLAAAHPGDHSTVVAPPPQPPVAPVVSQVTPPAAAPVVTYVAPPVAPPVMQPAPVRMVTETRVETYKGKRQNDAAKDFSKEASKMAKDGWRPVAQSWAPGKSGCMRTVLMGFIFAWAIPPKGMLTVTYTREVPG